MRIRSTGGQDGPIDFGVAPTSIDRVEAPVTLKVRRFYVLKEAVY
jgi:hypothetical protein